MSIDLKTIKHIAKLSRISIDDKKAKELEKDLNSIFEFIEALNKVDTKKAVSYTHLTLPTKA